MRGVLGEWSIEFVDWREFRRFLRNLLVLNERILLGHNQLDVSLVRLFQMVQADDAPAFLQHRIEVKDVPHRLLVVNQVIFVVDLYVVVAKIGVLYVGIHVDVLKAL